MRSQLFLARESTGLKSTFLPSKYLPICCFETSSINFSPQFLEILNITSTSSIFLKLTLTAGMYPQGRPVRLRSHLNFQIPTRGGRFCPSLQRSHLNFPCGYVPALDTISFTSNYFFFYLYSIVVILLTSCTLAL